MTIRKLISITIFAALVASLSGQIEMADRVSPKKPERIVWDEITAPLSAINTLREIQPSKNQPYQFALPIAVSYKPGNSGEIRESNGEKIWTIGIRSKGALSLNLILSPFKLPEGGYFYLYNGDNSVVRGAFTDVNNNSAGVLPLIPLPGDEIILELHVPAHVDIHNTITISQVGHDFRGVFGLLESKDGFFKASGPCNKDVECYPDPKYINQRNAVTRLIIRGVELCTGTMINNVAQENIPYLLTAEHCISNVSDAASTVFFFRYESPWCSGPDGRIYRALSGSQLKASSVNNDFALVELNQFPPITYKPYLAGWDRSETPALNTYSIHHPQGDVKKITIDNNSPVTATYPGYASGGFWKIIQWEVGTTEPGSSGGALFNQAHRIIGTLTGGEAYCGLSVNDYYSKLVRMNDVSTLPPTYLAPWIDPGQTGVLALDGRDPYAPNNLTNDTLVNLPQESYSYTAYSLPGTGFSSGFNSDSVIMYAEYFENSRAAFITEVKIGLSNVAYVTLADSIRVFVYGDGPVPGTVLTSRKFLISESNVTNGLTIDFGDPVPVSGNFYIGWRLWYGTKAASETRQMAVKIAPNQGGTEFNKAWLNHAGIWKPFYNHPSFPVSTSLNVAVVTVGNSVVYSINKEGERPELLSVFPNPTNGIIKIKIPTGTYQATLSIYNINGASVASITIQPTGSEEVSCDITSLPAGIYIVKYQAGGKVFVGKVVKIE